MKLSLLTLLILPLFSCADENLSHENNLDNETQREIIINEFQSILDSVGVEGSILIYDLNKHNYYSNDFEWAKKGNLPASTFKITNSIIALEIGVVENDSTLFKWDGKKKRLKIWEQDLFFKQAFHYSCVPCYQQIARKIGARKMNEYLSKLEYGSMKVDSTNIDIFWLEGESQISQFQQINFLKRFYQSELPISKRTETIMKRLMIIEENEVFTLSGKTGWSIRNGNNNGWFVGYIKYDSKTYIFAINIEPKEEFNMDLFPMIRKEITHKALEQMKSYQISN